MVIDGLPLWRSLTGGALIGAGAALLMLGDGFVAGISGIFGRMLRRDWGEHSWRIAFLAGLMMPAVIFGPGVIAWQGSIGLLAVAGVLVGAGTQLGSGCTSGHGVCGIANWSLRSLVATITFIAMAVATVGLLRRFWHP